MILENCDSILNDPQRIKALEESGLMDSVGEEAFQRLNRLAALALKAPVSIFSVIGEDRQVFKSAVGLPPEMGPGTSFPLDVSVCMYALRGEPLQFEDTKNHPAFINNVPVKVLNIAGYLGIPLIDREGNALGTVCVFDSEKRTWSEDQVEMLQEITQSFLTEVELRKSLKVAEDEVQCREDFMSIASHELKTPLTSLKLDIHLVRYKQNKGIAISQDFLDKFERQLQRLLITVDDMFDISRINSGNFSLNRKPTNLSKLVGNVLERLAPVFNQVSCQVNFRCHDEHHGQWDSHRLEQVLENLLHNAIKYAPGAPIAVEVFSKDAQLLISIKDQGPGLPRSLCESIFEPFRRLGNDASVPGLGLGLYISKQIMKAHHGDILLDTKPGEGSTFTMVLPQ